MIKKKNTRRERDQNDVTSLLINSFRGYILMTRLFKFGLVLLLLRPSPFRDAPMRQVLDLGYLALFVMGFILCLPSYSLNL